MNPLYKKALISLSFYLMLLVSGILLHLFGAKGICAPGPVILVIILFPIVTLVLFLRDMHSYLINGNKSAGLSLILNSSLLLILITTLIIF